MGRPMNFNKYAARYSKGRYALKWVLEPLVHEVLLLQSNSFIVEMGCGTGDYIIALSRMFPQHNYFCFDNSVKMLEKARARKSTVKFEYGNCEGQFPPERNSVDFAYCVDVVHHIVSYENFFRETSRMLTDKGKLIIITDSEETLKRRSLTKYFPATLPIDMERYPLTDVLSKHALQAGLKLESQQFAQGEIDLASYLPKLKKKLLTALWIIKEADFRKGIERVEEAAAKNEKWFSIYCILTFSKI